MKYMEAWATWEVLAGFAQHISKTKCKKCAREIVDTMLSLVRYEDRYTADEIGNVLCEDCTDSFYTHCIKEIDNIIKANSAKTISLKGVNLDPSND